MEITRLTKRNHYEAITEQLKSMIISGQFKLGDKLPSTKELSEQFGVGRSTTREALSALRAMGLIDIRQGGGCTVISQQEAEIELPALQQLRMNRQTLLELLEVRLSLEVAHAGLAADKRSDEQLGKLSAIIAEMEATDGDDLAGERNDVLFHVALAEASGNRILLRMLESILSPLEEAIRDTRRVELYANREVAAQLLAEHRGIYEAVALQDRDLAASRMREHLLHVQHILMKYI